MTIQSLANVLVSICMLCCVQSVHGQFFRHAKDCTITIHCENYDADTLISSCDQVIRYVNGKEVYDLDITSYGHGHADTALVQTTYNERGEKTKIYRRIVADDQCIMEDEPCPVITTGITDFSDGFAVTRTWIVHDEDTSTAVDTVFFYPNGLARTHVSYEDEEFVSRTDFEYKFYEDGRISEIKTVDTTEGSYSTLIEGNMYRGEDTISLYMIGFDGRDSSNLRMYTYTYNDQLEMTGRRLMEEGKLSEFVVVHYTDEEHREETFIYTGDSAVRSHHSYWRTHTPGRIEMWMSQEYTNSPESNGSSYTRYDTVRTRRQTIVGIYYTRYSGNPASKIAPPLSECIFGNRVYDKQGRLVSQKNYEHYGGRLTFSVTFSYSR